MSDEKVTRILKRDGSLADFDREKVVTAIYKAAAAVGGHDRALSEKLADEVIDILNHAYAPPDMPSVEDVQDVVERVLIENNHARTAKTYIVYRENRRRQRERKSSKKTRERPLPYRLMYENLVWNLDHGCETIEKLNQHVRSGTIADLVKAADATYSESVACAAEAVAATEGVRLIIVAGPSSSGKTTTTAKLSNRLKELGVETVLLNLDHYFFNLELHPKDEYGDYDFETPEALDLNLINEHLGELVAGRTVEMPQYDFKTGKRAEHTQSVSMKPNQVILIDTLHGLHEPLSESVDNKMKFKVYIETAPIMRDEEGKFLRWTDIRLLRRMVRDHAHRGYDPKQTVGHWHYVRRSELKHIIPFIRDADYILNGALPYELPFHKKHSYGHFPGFIKAWAGDRKRRDAFIRAERVFEVLTKVEAYDDESIIPGDSLLREFIGGSIYKLH